MKASMKMQPLRATVTTILLFLALPLLAQPSNKWRLEFNGKSKANGEMEISVTPEGGVATAVVVPIPERTTENNVARLVRDAISTAFGDIYHVEVDDGEDVLVKAKGGTPDFEIVVIRNTIEGIRLKLDRE